MGDSLICRIQALEDRPDSDNQNLDIDCDAGVLLIDGGQGVDATKLGTSTIYRMTPPVVGTNVRRWLAAPDAAAHDLPANIWTGPTDATTGFPTHPNTPTSQTVEADYAVAGPDDQIEAWGWVTVPSGGGFLRDNNANTGELGEVWIGYCCGTPVLQPGGAQDGIDTGVGGTDRFVMDVVPVPEGTHFVYSRFSDLSANQGIDLEFSIDGAAWANVESLADKPILECQTIAACAEIPEGWDTCPPETCSPVITPPPVVEETEPGIQISTAIPVADNEADTAIRTGQAGTTGLAADAGHNHPIVKQTHPAWPGATYTNAPLNAEIVLDQNRATEEWIEYEVRWDLNIEAGNNWPIIRVPAMAGFREPIITVVNTYRNGSTTFQTDDNDTPTGVASGAAPVGPYMGIEWSHWSSTRGIYGPFRRENAYRQFVIASMKYVRL